MSPTYDEMIIEAKNQAFGLEATAQKMLRNRDKTLKEEIAGFAKVATGLAGHLRDFAKTLLAGRWRKLSGLMVGWEDDQGEVWYLAHCWNWGNLVRTSDPEFAAIFESVTEVDRWLDSLRRSRGEDAKGVPWPAPITMLAGKEVMVFRVGVTVSETGRSYAVPSVLKLN